MLVEPSAPITYPTSTLGAIVKRVFDSTIISTGMLPTLFLTILTASNKTPSYSSF